MVKSLKCICKTNPFLVDFYLKLTFTRIFFKDFDHSCRPAKFKIASCQTPISVKQLSLVASLNRIHKSMKFIFIDAFHKAGALQQSRSLKNTCERVQFLIKLQAGSLQLYQI